MKILAIEASGRVAGAALAEGDRILGEMSLCTGLNHSVTLMPLVKDLMEKTGQKLEELDAIALTNGPGSFTGLRIGASTCKGLGMALGIPLIPVSTLMSLAANFPLFPGVVAPVMDARRGQVYAALYRAGEDGPLCIREPEALPLEELLSEAKRLGEPVVFNGDGTEACRRTIEAFREQEGLTSAWSFAPGHLNLQRASSTAILASRLHEREGDACLADPAMLRIEYLRRSQAERQLDEAKREGLMDALRSGTLVQRLKEREAQ